MFSKSLVIWVIYRMPEGSPKGFVVKPWTLPAKGGPLQDGGIHCVAATIGEARSSIPKGLKRLPRHGRDEAGILETWL